MENCIFCKIVNKELNSSIIYEDDICIAFKDLYPKADIHVLIIPKEHIASMLEIETNHVNLMGKLMVNVNKIAKQLNLEGYKVHINSGIKGGQEVFHLHIHLLANV